MKAIFDSGTTGYVESEHGTDIDITIREAHDPTKITVKYPLAGGVFRKESIMIVPDADEQTRLLEALRAKGTEGE